MGSQDVLLLLLCEYIIFNSDIKVRGLSKFKIVIKIHWVYKFESSLLVYICTLLNTLVMT